MGAMEIHQNTRDRLTHVINQWIYMWNGDHDLVEDLIAPEFRIWFGSFPRAGDGVKDPTTFRHFLDAYRAENADARFVPGEMVVDEIAGRGALVWTLITTPPNEDHLREVGGVDQFSFAEGRVRQVWSMGGTEARPF
jgi:SnoaL-like domain